MPRYLPNLRIALSRAVRQPSLRKYTLVFLALGPSSVSLHALAPQPVVSDLVLRVLALGAPLALLLGARLATADLRAGVVGQILIARPQRRRWVLAQLGSVWLCSVVVAAGFAAITLGCALGAAFFAGLPAAVSAPWTELAIRTGSAIIVMAMFSVLGGLLGLLVGNDRPIVAGWLLWYFAAELLVIAWVPDSGKFLPGGWVDAALGLQGQANLLFAVSCAGITGFLLLGPTLWIVGRRDVN